MELLALLNCLKIGTKIKIIVSDTNNSFNMELTKRSANRNGINSRSIINTNDYFKLKKEGVNVHSIVKSYINGGDLCCTIIL